LRLVVATWHRVGEEQFAGRQAIGEVHEQLLVNCRRHIALIQHGAPGDVAGIVGLLSGQEQFAHRRASAVRTDQKVPALVRAVGKDRTDGARILLDAEQ